MGLVTNYSVGGVIDEIKKVNIPGITPDFYVPYAKGFQIDVPALAGTYFCEYTLQEDMVMSGVAIACSGYRDKDFWELSVGNQKIFETIYTKELPETIGTSGGLAAMYLIKAGTKITIDFHNDSCTSKKVWVNIRFYKRSE